MEFNKCLYKCLPWWLCVCLSWELLKKLALLVSSTTKYKFYEKRSFWDIIIFRCFIWILFRDLRFRLWGIEIKRLKANNFVWKVCFSSFVIISQLRRPIEFKFHRFFSAYLLRYSRWEDWSLSLTKKGPVSLNTALIYAATNNIEEESRKCFFIYSQMYDAWGCQKWGCLKAPDVVFRQVPEKIEI